jgi:hypothetical protein
MIQGYEHRDAKRPGSLARRETMAVKDAGRVSYTPQVLVRLEPQSPHSAEQPRPADDVSRHGFAEVPRGERSGASSAKRADLP